MGLFDIVEDLLDIGSDIVSLPFKIAGAAIELGNDIGETVSQDVKNKVSGNPDAPTRTSYDIRDEADKVIDVAKKQVYEAKSELDTVWYETSQKAIEVADKRREVYILLGRETSTALMKLPDQPSNLLYPSDAPRVDSSFDFGTSIGFAGTSMRMEAAENYLEKANEYHVKMKVFINKINSLKRTVLNVSDAQKEELAMLNIIQSIYKGRSKTILTQSAELLHNIAELCVQQVNSNTDTQYRNLLQQLKRLWN